MLRRKQSKVKLAAAAIILSLISAEEQEESRKKIKRKRIWMNERNKQMTGLTYSDLLKEKQLRLPAKYRNFLRMDSTSYDELLERVKPLIEKQNTTMREAIPPNERLSTTLHFLANGLSYAELKFGSRIARSTLSTLIIDTCKAIIKVLKDFIQLPKEEEKWKNEAMQFEELWDFPNCIGVLDGKHINIKKPQNSPAHYLNDKKTYSIVLMVVVNAKYEFQMVEISANGRVSDGEIFSNTEFSDKLENDELNIPSPRFVNSYDKKLPYVFVADDAFPLNENIVKSFNGSGLNEKQKNYNYRVFRARRVVENIFGIIASRFRILLTINLRPEKTRIIVLAICYLHNYLQQKSYSSYIGSTDIENFTTNYQNTFNNLELGRNYNPEDDEKSTRENYMEYFHLHRI